MSWTNSEHVRPLQVAEHRFLQVLLTGFTLMAQDEGVSLQIEFDGDTPAIWSVYGKTDVRSAIQPSLEKAADYQQKLNEVLVSRTRDLWRPPDAQLPFRFASGGTLPIIRYRGRDYFCLFYREIFPIGWNIANGGSDTIDELLNPLETVERELREELMVVDRRNCRWYVFEGDAEKALDRPEFAAARRLWTKLLPGADPEEYERVPLPVKWISGPDTLDVRYGGEHAIIPGCFLTITAEDFGIEVDRVARIHLDAEAALLDGELCGTFLLNQPVGLFPTDRWTKDTVEKPGRFEPEFVFYSGIRHVASELERVIEAYVNHTSRVRHAEQIAEYSAARAAGRHCDLCPVSRSLLSRYLPSTPPPPPPVETTVQHFVSYGGPDERHALEVSHSFAEAGIPHFCSTQKNAPQWVRAIDEALESATHFIAVATHPKHLRRSWPSYEFSCFVAQERNGRKPPGARVVPFISFKEKELPALLQPWTAIHFNPDNPAPGLADLASYLATPPR